MPLTSVLFKFYTFSEFVSIVYNNFGVGNLIILGLSYFTVLVYVAMITRSNPLSIERGRLYIGSFVREIAFMVLVLVIVLLFQSLDLWHGFLVFAHFSLIYVVIYLAREVLLRNMKYLSSYESYFALRTAMKYLPSYESYFTLRTSPYPPLLSEVLLYIRSLQKKMYESMQAHGESPDKTKILTHLARMWRSRALFWAMMLVLGYYFIVFDPSFPFICWILIVYSLAMGGVTGAVYYAFLIHARTTPYLIIETSNKEKHEGFLITKNKDFYILKTGYSDRFILRRLVVKITLLEYPPENTT